MDIKYVPTICPYCGVGCGMNLVVQDEKVVGVEPWKRHPVNEGKLCPKGNFCYEIIHRDDRLTTPLIKENGEFREATWDEAYDLIASKLGAYDPNEIGFFCCARSPNENIYVNQKFARIAVGTQNIDHCARLCHGPTVAGLAASFGSGAMTNSYDSFEDADLIFSIGANSLEAHPLVGRKLMRAKMKGAYFIVADPRYTPTAKQADQYIPFKTGTDVALMNAMMNVIISEGLEDKEFIEKRTKNYEELKKVVAKYTPEMAAEITQVPADVIRDIAIKYAKADKAAIVYSLGITEHSHGVDNVQQTANLAMLTGNIGRLGTGVNPLRGQNNVQGACDMGALPTDYPGYRKVADEEVMKDVTCTWGCSDLGCEPGLKIPEMIESAYKGDLKVLYITGEDPVISDPDTHHVEAALENLDFFVVQDIFMTDTAEFADVVLPAACWAEQEGTFTNGERRVQLIRKAVDAPGESKYDWEIFCDLAKRMGADPEMFTYESAQDIFEEVRTVTPQYAGMNRERLERPEALHWPCPSEDHPGTAMMHVEKFAHPDGLGIFSPLEEQGPVETPDEEYPLILTTTRLLFHYHAAMTRRASTLDREVPTGYVEINTEDAAKLGIINKEKVKVKSRRGEIEIPARVTDDIIEGIVNIPMHFRECSANILTNAAAIDPRSGMPEYKACAVAISKMEGSK
jgi:formate dehydrogenase (coenzyme F420) alpha subunit